jgi:diguanylate cyclase (GGDEF)-like protein
MPPDRDVRRRAMLAGLLVFAVAWLNAAESLAAPGDAAPPPGRFAFRSYDSADGLNNLAVRALLQDRHGLLWVGTEDGLHRYEGGRFRHFGPDAGLPSSEITALHESPDGTLWVGTFRGLARRTGERFELVHAGLPAIEIRAIASDAKGRLWVTTRLGPFSGTARAFTVPSGWPGTEADGLWAGHDTGDVWIASGTRLWQVSGAESSWREWGRAQGLGNQPIHAIKKDGAGSLWARSTRGLWRLPAGGSRFVDLSDRVPVAISSPVALDLDRQGRLLVPTSEGLARFTGERFEMIGRAQGFPVAWARTAIEDRDGSLWIGCLGVHRQLSRGAWQAYTVDNGLPSDMVRTVWRDPTGRLWIGTDRGLAEATSTGWPIASGTEGHAVRSVVAGPDGAYYLAGVPAEILRLDPSTQRADRVSHPTAQFGERIFRLLVDTDGSLYAATESAGLVRGRLQGRGTTGWRFERVVLPAGTPNEYVSDLHLDARGRLWVAGAGGLAVRSGGRWLRFTAKDGLPEDHVAYVTTLANGDTLVTPYDSGGIIRGRLEGDRFRITDRYDAERTLWSDKVYVVGQDARGLVWVGTGGGVDVLHDHGVQHFGLADGVVGEDVNATAFQADANGDVWIGTSGGLGRFSASRYGTFPQPPATRLLSAMLGSKELVTGAAVPPSTEETRAANTLEAQFMALTALHESQLQHQYRLVGLEDEWHQSSDTSVRYPALPPGDYRLEVRTRTGRGEWGAPTTLGFHMPPAWWQTWWFGALLALAVAALVALVVRWRVRALQGHNVELQALVDTRTRALAEANEALRTLSLTDPLTRLRNRRYLDGRMAELSALGHSAASGAGTAPIDGVTYGLVLADLDHFKSINDHYGHAAGDRVLQQVADVLLQCTRTNDSVVRWGGEEFLIVFETGSAQELTTLADRIVKAIARETFDVGDGRRIRTSCSIGCACYPFHEGRADLLSWEQVLALADWCLREAKHRGRDTWVACTPKAGADPDELGRALPHDIVSLVDTGEVSILTPMVPAEKLQDFGGRRS